jgi:hypothetical protein
MFGFESEKRALVPRQSVEMPYFSVHDVKINLTDSRHTHSKLLQPHQHSLDIPAQRALIAA